MSLKGLIFDFDGLILDTESPEMKVWQEIFAEYGFEFPIVKWIGIVGGDAESRFDAACLLEELTEGKVKRADSHQRWHDMSLDRIHQGDILPGVMDLLIGGRNAGLPIVIASSSPHSWVDGHVTRLGIGDYFDKVICREDVEFPKPAPDLFLAALEFLELEASGVVIFEDSANGITAAKVAGVFCVNVPNEVTCYSDTSHADLVLDSLAELSFEALTAMFDE